jgi:hypothetical protein
MLTEREPSHPPHLEYCPIFGARTASCSTFHGREPSQRKTRKWRTFANDRIRPPGIPSLKHASSNVFLIRS